MGKDEIQLNRATLKALAIERLADATTLLEKERFSAAFYLSGYSVECALKACIAKKTREYDFPNKKQVTQSWTHNLEELLKLIDIPMVVRNKKETQKDLIDNPALLRNWSFVSIKWSEEARYNANTESAARAIIDAISNPNDGVLQWLQKYW